MDELSAFLAAICEGNLPFNRAPRHIGHHRSKTGRSFAAEISLGQFSQKGQTLQVMIVRDISERLQAEGLRQQPGLAKEFQQRLLPAKIPRLPGFDIHAATIYCAAAGGDYFD